MSVGVTHVFHQTAFRLRDDTADSNEDAGWLADLNTDWTQETDTPFRVRWNIEHEGVVGSSQNAYMDLWYSLNGGTWLYVDNEDEVYQTDPILYCIESSNTAGYVQGTDTTYLLGSAEALQADNNGIVESRGWSSPNANWAGDGVTRAADYEFCLTLRSSLVSPGDSIGLRVYYNDISLDIDGSYEVDATITVAGAEQPNTGTIMKVQGATAAIRGSTLTIK